MIDDRRFSRVLRNALLNLLGNIAPLATAAFAVPVLLHRLGTAGFGLFSLIWVVLGYFSIFDLGLSRALTRLIAEYLATGRRAQVPDLVCTVLWLLVALGALGGLACIGAVWLRVLAAGYPEGMGPAQAPAMALMLLLGVPATLVVTGVRGILEGHQDFSRANALRVPAGIALMGLPAICVLWFPDVLSAVAALLAARLSILALHLVAARSYLADLRGRFAVGSIGLLLRFGGWLTVSNIVGPVIVYIDRFVLAAELSATAVGLYTAPFEIVTRLLVVPQALANALFPALTVAQTRDADHFRHLFRRALVACLAVVLPLALVLAVASDWLLRTWLGNAFGGAPVEVMRVLLVGLVFNSLAQLPLTALHSQGHARRVAIMHVIELPLYVAGLTVLVRKIGLAGAAWAWSARALIDCTCLLWMAARAMTSIPATDAAARASDPS